VEGMGSRRAAVGRGPVLGGLRTSDISWWATLGLAVGVPFCMVRVEE